MRLNYKRTEASDLQHLIDLWNDGEVMQFVGFPKGLGYDMAKAMVWLEDLNKKENTIHYSIYDDDVFLGELFYSAKAFEKAIIDVKLMNFARGKNVGFQGLCFLLDQLFRNTEAKIATVDPHQNNYKAIQLYEKCGFRYMENTVYNREVHKVFDIDRDRWFKRRRKEIHFEDVTRENYRTIIRLKVLPEQKHFIAENTFSLAQAAYEPECIAKAIYCDANPVGFIMWCIKDKDDGLVWIYRLMIDQMYQHLGYGKEAMTQILPYLKTISKEKKIHISFEPENENAKALYEKMGFMTTGIISGGEVIYELKF